MGYYKKSHAHKPKKGKGSYDRGEALTDEAIEEILNRWAEYWNRPENKIHWSLERFHEDKDS